MYIYIFFTLTFLENAVSTCNNNFIYSLLSYLFIPAVTAVLIFHMNGNF